MSEIKTSKKPRLAFVIAGILIVGAAINWYFHLNPETDVMTRRELSFYSDGLPLFFVMAVYVVLYFNVQTTLGKTFWALLFVDSLLNLFWEFYSREIPVETYFLVNRIDLTIIALIWLVFAYLERIKKESLFGI